MAFTIRSATNDDVVGVVRVVKAVFDEYGFTWDAADYHADLYDLEAHYASHGAAFFVAEQEGHVVGTVALAEFSPIPGDFSTPVVRDGFVRIAGTDCALERLYVDPPVRKNGVGQALLQRVIDEAKTRDRKAMEMWSDKRFGDAHRLYERLGARVVAERICHDPDKSPEWGLILPLQ